MTQHFSELMEKEVSRKEFLGMTGLAVASIFGFSTAVKILTGHSLGSSHQASHGYGASPYGGNREQ